MKEEMRANKQNAMKLPTMEVISCIVEEEMFKEANGHANRFTSNK